MKRIFSIMLSFTVLLSTILPVNLLILADDKEFTAEQAVDIYLNNYEMWDLSTCDDYMPMGYRYGFLDLDFDGNLELITSKLEGSGRYSYNEFYTIDTESLKVIKLDHNNLDRYNDEFDLFSYGDIKLLYYFDIGKPMYYCFNYERTYSSFGLQTWGTLSFDNDAVVSNPLFEIYSENYEDEYYIIIDGDRCKTSATNFDIVQQEYFANTVDLNVSYSHIVSWDWEKASKSDRKKMLLASYNAFSFDALKSIAVFSTEKSMSVCTNDEMWLAFGIYDKSTNSLDGDWKKMSLVVSNPEIISLSDYEKTEYGYSIQVKGLKQGKSNVVISDAETGLNTTIEINVYDKYSKTYSYSITDMPEFYPNNKYENHLKTNIYNVNGIYVNNYECQKKNGKYSVSFDVYNSNYYYGAVDIYDKDGLWIGFEEIKKYSDIKSMYDTGHQAYFMITDLVSLIPGGEDSNFLTYQQESFSKKTSLNFEVPEGGYFTISNNATASFGTVMANGLEIIFDSAFFALDLAMSDDMKTTAFDSFVKSMKKSFSQNVIDARNECLKKEMKKKFDEVIQKEIESKFKDSAKSYINTSIKDKLNATNQMYDDIANITDNLLSRFKVDWKECFKSSVGLGESLFTAFSGPAGLALKGVFAISKTENKLLMGMQLANSLDKPYVNVYSETSNSEILQNGIILETYGNTDAETVLQTFRVSNDKNVEILLDDNNPLEKCEMYNICLVKNDQTVQPNGLVKVQIPIPNGMNGTSCNVYRQEIDGSWSILDANIEGNYLVFYTEHFSNYAVVGEIQELQMISLPNKLDYFQGDTIDTSGMVVVLNGETIKSECICDPYIVSDIGKQTITVKYGYAITTFEVNVKERKCYHTSTTKHKEIESTCQEQGEYGYIVCNECFRIIDGKIGQIPFGNHNWDNGRIIIDATCVSVGLIEYKCVTNNCKETKNVSIPVTGKHTLKTTLTKATTSKNGSKITKCTVCGTQTAKSTIYYPKTITLSTTKYTYDGKVKKPTVKVVDANGKTVAASNYTVTYASGRKNVGKYTVKIAFKGNYSGTVSKTFTIVPKTTSISSLTAASRGFTVKWKKQATQTAGYQIQIATDSKFTKGLQSYTVTKNSTLSKKITKLTGKKKYYVRIRTYKTVSGTKYYSTWSGFKAVTTKK